MREYNRSADADEAFRRYKSRRGKRRRKKNPSPLEKLRAEHAARQEKHRLWELKMKAITEVMRSLRRVVEAQGFCLIDEERSPTNK